MGTVFKVESNLFGKPRNDWLFMGTVFKVESHATGGGPYDSANQLARFVAAQPA